MAVDSKKYLAENVLNERRTVTYRSLSRALKVHSHVAKRMLYDFHHNENSKKPNSVNATYVITGVQHPSEPHATNGDAHESDGDDIMQSSPYISSSMPNQDAAADTVTGSSIILVREEDLEDAKLTFRSISSIHVYSLQPAVLQDLNVLTDVSHETLAAYAHEDPLEFGKQWGMIQNQNVKRRTGARPPRPPAAASTQATPNTTVPAKRPLQSDPPKPEPSKPNDTADSKQPPQKGSSQPPSKHAAKPAPLKKEKSNLFSSFAKAKPKQKKEEAAPGASGAESAAASGAEDLNLGDASEEEPEELFPESGKPASTSNRESRKEREERLKKMMEDDDEEQGNDADEEMPDVAEPEEEPEEPAPINEPPLPPKKQELKEEVTVQGGRRRGKRQVMKKKTVKDEEGYLVTREEPSWESFSEEEPAAPPPKKKPAVNASKGKLGAKPGQGSIMSFFGKK
ncbi:uncharacterized protein ASPGLDRAFT_54511 [Aspergillus glaucus CBS 516.65]|uniref:DNA polymerase delta subunit 3 n=1 Tax=Aspergillus glaucus CBS 516.65 TaxID=1160497 RepID=A0A1L9VX30_ASPGL|nr:hypothetical protein ASPGLDRAFT_54511 [Aspergillus glaucus CBS 516.65]OJJ88456.1 hypothetical protein ASPGLDRAFT_54511 [Aspergillus glaucus CBS 516.65]